MEKQEVLKNEDEILIFADNREFQSNIAKELARKDCTVRPQQLEVGDFILSERVCIERKTAEDFLSSVFDQRIFEQLKELKRNFERPLLLIEGENLYDKRDVHPNSVRGCLASIAVDMEVPTLWSKSEKDSAELLFWIARREQVEEDRDVSLRGEKQPVTLEEKQLYLVSGLPGIDRKMAERLLEEFGTPEKVFTAGEDELKEVKGIGEKTARNLRQVLVEEGG